MTISRSSGARRSVRRRGGKIEFCRSKVLIKFFVKPEDRPQVYARIKERNEKSADMANVADLIDSMKKKLVITDIG